MEIPSPYIQIIIGGYLGLRKIILLATISTVFLIAIPTLAQCDLNTDYKQIGFDLSGNGNYEQAIIALTCAIEDNPNDVDSYFYRAGSYSLLYMYDEAITDYTRVIEQTFTDSSVYYEAHFLRGLLFSNFLEHEATIADLTVALDGELRNDSILVAYSNRSSAYLATGEYDLALADINTAVERAPQLARLYVLRGYIYSEQGEDILAISDWFYALELEPNLTNSYREAAVIASRTGFHQNSIQLIDYAITIDALTESIRFENYILRSYSQLTLGNYIEALIDANTALSIDENGVLDFEPQLLLVRAQAYIELGLLDLALSDVNQYIEIDINNPESYRVRGDIYYLQENFQDALDSYQQYDAMRNNVIDEEIQTRINELQNPLPQG